MVYGNGRSREDFEDELSDIIDDYLVNIFSVDLSVTNSDPDDDTVMEPPNSTDEED